MELNVFNKPLYVKVGTWSSRDVRQDVMDCTDANVVRIKKFYKDRLNSGLCIQFNWLYFILRDTKYRIHISNYSEEYTYIKVIMRKLGLHGCHTFYYDGGVID